MESGKNGNLELGELFSSVVVMAVIMVVLNTVVILMMVVLNTVMILKEILLELAIPILVIYLK